MLAQLRQQAARQPRRILLPEIDDPRVREAARWLAGEGLASPVLLESHSECSGMETFSDLDNEDHWRKQATEQAAQLNDCTTQEAADALQAPLVLAAALLQVGYVDGAVSGSLATTADVLRAGFKGLGVAPGCDTVSSFFLMELNDGRLLSYADCAVVPEPSIQQLAEIAVATAQNHRLLTGATPRVAMLSFSSKGSATHPSAEKMQQATEATRLLDEDLLVDGELQFDAAFNSEIAAAKAPDSPLGGAANVFIFPDLNAGNIAYKITQQISGARAVGPLLQGMAKPWMDLSRGCNADDIVDAAIVASLMAGSS